MITDCLIDNSAWSRLQSGQITDERLIEVANAFETGHVYTCLPFLLEAGSSGRSHIDHERLMTELGALPRAAIDAESERIALDAQAKLARTGHHRLPPVDLMVAAIAARRGLAVLHYDADYDLIAERTDLAFESVWLAPRGSL